MSDFRGLRLGGRPPTWAEREAEQRLRDAGVSDVYVEPEEAPGQFWETVLIAADEYLLRITSSPDLGRWRREFRWATGWPEFSYTESRDVFRALVHHATIKVSTGHRGIAASHRMAAIEHLIDVLDDSLVRPDDRAFLATFRDAINDRARRFRVGIKLEGTRFVSVTSEHVHQEIVRPALVLLADPRFEDVDDLYRKAFARRLGGDPAGAVTVAVSAIEEMLRVGLDDDQGKLVKLADKARSDGWMDAGVRQQIVKLEAFREHSDAHFTETDDDELAQLVLHIAASVLLFLGETMPVPEE